MPNRAVTTLSYPCPNCDETCWQDVDGDGKAVGLTTADCTLGSAACMSAYVNGLHLPALAAAWVEYCDQDWSEAWNRRYSGDNSGADDGLERMRDAQRYKR